MPDIATLGIKIENGDVIKATASLNALAVAGEKSEDRTAKLTRRMALAEMAARSMDAELGRNGRTMALLQIEAQKMDAEYGQASRQMALMEIEARKMNDALAEGTKGHEIHVQGLSRIGNGLAALVGHATGVPPILEKIGDAVGIMAIGHIATVGVLAGFAAIAFGYEKITERAREAEEQARKTATEFDRIAHMDVKGQGGAASLLYAGDPNAGLDKEGNVNLAAFGVKELERQRAEFERRTRARMPQGGPGGITMVLTEDARTAVDALKKVNEELEHRNKLLQSLSVSIPRAGIAGAAADLPGQITDQLREQKRVADEAAREAERMQRQADVLANAKNKEAISAVKAIEHTRLENDGLRALIAARNDSKEAIDAATIAQAGNLAVAQQAADISPALAAGVRREAEEHARLTIQLNDEQAARKAAEEAAKKAAADALEATRRQLHEVDRLLKSTFNSLFTSIFTSGKSIFQALFDAIKQGFLRLVSDILAARLSERIAASALGGIMGSLIPGAAGAQGVGGAGATNYLGGNIGAQTAAGVGAAGIGGALAGYGTGASLYSTSHGDFGNYARGALGGSASGALTGAMVGAAIGPIGAAAGAAIGGITGFVGGLFGAGSAAKEAAKAMVLLQASIKLNYEAMDATIRGDPLGVAIAQAKAYFDEQRKLTEDAYSGGSREVQRVAILHQLDDQEARRIQQLKDEAIATRQTSAAMLNLTQSYKAQYAVFAAINPGLGAGGQSGGMLMAPTSRTSAVSAAPTTLQPLVFQVDGRTLAQAMLKQYGGRSTGSPDGGFIELVSKVT